jgi:hypothetical protein
LLAGKFDIFPCSPQKYKAFGEFRAFRELFPKSGILSKKLKPLLHFFAIPS